MKKIFTFLITAIFFAGAVNAQVFSSRFDTWSSGVPAGGWSGTATNLEADSTVQITTGTQYGANACQMINEESQHRRLTTTGISVSAGQAYDITYWVKGQGDIRGGLFDNHVSDGDYGYTYASYISVNSTGWTQYTQTVVADTTNPAAEFILSSRGTVPTSHLQVDSVVVTLGTVPTVNIYDIQYTAQASGDSPYKGQPVTTSGIVTASHSGGFFLQDSAGAWHGVYVYNPSNTTSRGDSVTITASVAEYFNNTQLENATSLNINSSGNTLPGITNVSTSDIGTTSPVGDEKYEGVLVKVSYASCTTLPNSFGEWTVDDGSGDAMISDMFYAYTPTVGTSYHVQGPVSFSYSSYKIEPRDNNDITVTTDIEENTAGNNISVYPVPASDKLTISLGNANAVQLTLLSVDGREVLNTSTSERELNIDVSDFDAGIYFVKISDNERIITNKKIVIQR